MFLNKRFLLKINILEKKSIENLPLHKASREVKIIKAD